MTANPKDKLMTLSDMEGKYGINRQTLQRRLERHDIEPEDVPLADKKHKQAKFYKVTPEVEEIIKSKEESILNIKKGKIADLDYQKKEIELEERRGNLLNRAEVECDVTELFKGLYTRCVIQDLPGLVKRIRAAKTEAQALELAKTLASKPWNEARENYKRFVK